METTPDQEFLPRGGSMRNRRGMPGSLAGLAILAGSIASICCQSSPNESGIASRSAAQASAARKAPAVPKPIAGGDYFPDLPHHRAGIIHQFYPIDVALGGDGPW